MRPSHLALLLIGACLSWQTRGFAQTPAKPPVTVNSAAATALLDAAIAALSRPQGVEVAFVQTVHGRSLPATISGRSITADKQRAHIELNFQQVGRHAGLKLLCDGVTFYRLESFSNEPKMITYTMQELRQVLDSLATNETERVAKEDVEKAQQGVHGFGGLSAMIIDLKKKMVFSDPVADKLDLPGKPATAVKVIEGKWSNEVLDLIAPPKQGSDPNQQDRRYLWNEKLEYFQWPRTARLYFDAGTGQLYRIELWGVLEKQGPEKLLVGLDIQSITPLTTLDAKLFQPTEVELKYKPIPMNLAEFLKSRHMQTMDALKQQQLQNQSR